MDLEEIARKYALENAVEYGGECNPSAVIGKVINETGEEPSKAGEIAGRVCGQVNQLSLKEQKEEMEKYEYEQEEHVHDPLPDLQNAEKGEVVLRFAPNPNGPPHIGHARGMVINGELAIKYGGRLVLRFDDTDPRKKRPREEAYGMYREDFEWLGYSPDTVLRASRQFEKYFDHAEELIRMGEAYVCECPPEKARKLRSEGTACDHRAQSPGENMEKWERMRSGDGYSEGEAVLKIKTNIEHKNPAVRDFVAFRIIENPDHPTTGNKYRVFPLLDFQGAIEDYYTETTHIVRGKDLRASTERQKYIYDYLGWEYPEVRYWGNVQISGFDAPVSSSTIGEMVDSGELDGWDDPRAPTLRALKRRGFQPEAIQNFFIDMGVSERDIEASVETLESENRDIVEDSDRCFFVRNPVELEVSGIPEEIEVSVPLHPDHPDRGDRSIDPGIEDGKTTVLVEEKDLGDGLLRLKGFCNVEISGSSAEYVEGDHRDAMGSDAAIVHWLPVDSETATVNMPDGSEVEGRIEREIEDGEVVQFERFGFARKDPDGAFYYTHD